jgi:hypothetical protein
MHPVGDQQDTPMSNPAVTVGVGTMVHVDPFQRSATRWKSPFPVGNAVPTAMQNELDRHDTEASVRVPPFTPGTGEVSHFCPFHRIEKPPPAVAVELPVAMHHTADAQETLTTITSAGGLVGVAVIDQDTDEPARRNGARRSPLSRPVQWSIGAA